nr:glycosyl hydrolase [uncultured Solibaculum sp.]
MKVKKILASILAAAMALSAFSFSAFAQDIPEEEVLPDNGRPAVTTEGFDLSPVKMVDENATPETKSLYAYLKNISKDYTLFGHQNETTNTIIKHTGIASDTYNSVGAYPGVFGYSVGETSQVIDAYEKGGIVVVEHHVNNLATGSSYGDMTNGSVASVLPGGELHQNLVDYLDEVADFASTLVDPDTGKLIPVIYRPWHEHNGDWFWWDTKSTTEGEIRELFRFTVEYLRDVRGVHNFIYAFSPNGHYENEEEYLYGYPGDEYVDLLGCDVYWDVPETNPTWFDQLIKDLRIIVNYANKTGKVAALTETGIRWDASNGLALQNAAYGTEWYTLMRDAIMEDPIAKQIAYMLVWRNGGYNHFWVPFRDDPTYGDHEMLPDFVEYYNEEDILFADRLTGMYDLDVDTVENRSYINIDAPVFKENIENKYDVKVHASLFNGDEISNVVVRIGDQEVEAQKDPDSSMYVAAVDTTLLEDGRQPISVEATLQDNRVLRYSHDVFVDNMEDYNAVDLYLVDDFESYDNTQDNRTDLEQVWNRDGGDMNGLRIRNSSDKSGHWTAKAWNNGMDTGNVLRIKYDTCRNNWNSITRSMNGVDWSDVTTMGTWVQPDGVGMDLCFRMTTATGTFQVSFNHDLAQYGYDKSLVAPQYVAFPIAEFKNIKTGAAVTADDLAQIQNFTIRFEADGGRIAGLNALTYYLLDDIRAFPDGCTLTSDNSVVGVNEEFTLTAITPATINRVGLVNENGKVISLLKVKSVLRGDKKVWELKTKVGTQGDRTLTLRTYENGMWNNSASANLLVGLMPDAPWDDSTIQEEIATTVDNFENYGGQNLAQVYRSQGDGATASLAEGLNGSQSSMKITYQLGNQGYAGVSKTSNLPQASWGLASGVKLLYKGDGNGQDVLVQIACTANNKYFEAHLNEATGFDSTSTDIQEVTLPFEMFKNPSWQPDGTLDLSKGVKQLSVYINAMDGFTSEGSDIYVDEIELIIDSPVFGNITAQKGFVNQALSVDASASVTVDGQETNEGITYSLVDAPKGAQIDQNGRLIFVPQQLGNYQITVKASYNGMENFITIPVSVECAFLAPNESVAVNEMFHVKVVVPYQVNWVGVQNEKGSSIGLSNMSVSQKGMWKTYEFDMNIGTAGWRTMHLVTETASGKQANGAEFMIYVTK